MTHLFAQLKKSKQHSPQQHSPRRYSPKQRKGFTLVELMVVMSIFAILLVLTAGYLRLTQDSDRVKLSSVSLRGFLEGGRTRSFKIHDLGNTNNKDYAAVGVRFYTDPEDWTIITSMAYIVQERDRGTLQIKSTDTTPYKHVEQATGLDWSDLDGTGKLVPGTTIRIGTTSSGTIYNTYTVVDGTNLASSFNTLVSNDEFEVYPPDGGLSDTQILPYEMTLSPSLLPDTKVVSMPAGTVIDLKSSNFPDSWAEPWQASKSYSVGDIAFPTNSSTGQYYFQATSSGTTDASEPTWNTSGNTTDNSVTWVPVAMKTDRPTFDLLFSPQGTVIGSETVKGVLYFAIALRKDTDMGLSINDLYYSQDDDGSANMSNTPDINDARPRGEQRILVFYTQSGMMIISPIDLTEGADPYRAADPFSLAKQGKETEI